MTAPTKAILFDLRAYVADNNLRRSVASFSINYGSTAEALSLNTFVVALASTVVVTSPMNPSTVTMLRTSQPINATLTFRNSSTLTTPIKKLLVLDSDVASISITNNVSNTEAAKVTVLQG
jgi:hypothetical protein